MYVVDLETQLFVAANDTALALYGYTREAFLGMSLHDLEASHEKDCLWHDEWSGAVRHRRQGGVLIDLEVTSRPFAFQGHAARIIAAKDVTERLRLEEELRSAQKMEAVGRLAGGVAHDYNNMLSIILGYTNLLLDGLTQPDPSYEALMEIRRAGERSAELTRQLLTFSRRQPQKAVILDMNTGIAAMDTFLRRLAGTRVDVHLLLGPAICRVKVDSSHFERILMNLVVNARDAMPRGGTLTITTGIVGPDGSDPGSFVKLTVQDSGTGMNDETRARIFEPFFTTKEEGKGTGLGLSIVFGIVQQSGGRIRIESAPGQGTAFALYFPLVDDDAEPIADVTTVPTGDFPSRRRAGARAPTERV